MWNRISDFIVRHHLIDKGGRHLVALSGGADSVAMLLILEKLGYRIEAVHCNFHLRGEESNRDEAFARALCEAHNIPIHLAHFETRDYAALHKVSIEMAARELRYRYFEQLRSDLGASSICVAHHRDDAVETLLMNLMRGGGIHGLTGIRPRNGYVVRPMLAVGRQEIEDYLKSVGQSYVTDSTNLVDDVLRNKIRLNLIPLMEQILPSSSENISRSAENIAEAEKVYRQAVESEKAEIVRKVETSIYMPVAESTESVKIQELQVLPSPESFLYEWLTPYGFTSAQIQQIDARLGAGAMGQVFQTASHQLYVEREELVVTPKQMPIPSQKIPETGTYIFNGTLKFRFESSDDVFVSKSEYCATLDEAKVLFPLTIRATEEGDRFQPYGMKGRKLVSDYLTNCKTPQLEKRRQLVVTDKNGNIIWLVGLRTDHRYRIDETTTSVLRMEVMLN